MKYFNNSTLLLFTGRDEELGPSRSVNIKTTPTEAKNYLNRLSTE